MTTIAKVGNTIAVDSRVTNGSRIITDKKNKIRKRNGVFFILSGPICDFEELINCYCNDIASNQKEANRAEAVIIENDNCFHIQFFKNELTKCECEYIETWGSGREYALAAIRMGASAKKAITIAKQCDTCTGGKIRTIKIRKSE